MEATIILSAAMAVLMVVLLHTFFYAPKIADLEDDIDMYKKYVDKHCKVEPDPLPHPFLPSMKNPPPPPPPAKIPGTVTDEELSLRDLIYRRDIIVSKMQRLVDMMRGYSANGIAINSAQADFDELEKREREISDMIMKSREIPKGDYTRGGIVSGNDPFDALRRCKPETIVPPNKIKEILGESIGAKNGELLMGTVPGELYKEMQGNFEKSLQTQMDEIKRIFQVPEYINPFMDLETAEIAARNKKYSSYQISRGWTVPNENKNWWGILLHPAYKIMIPRTTGKTITDISTTVGNYGQNN